LASLNWKFPTLKEFKEGIARAAAKLAVLSEIEKEGEEEELLD